MFILKKLNEISFDIASLGKIGKWNGGGILASSFAFPIILIGNILFDFSPAFFYWSLAVLAGISLLIIFLAVNFVAADRYPSDIVLDKVWGMIVTFAFVPLKWKLMIFGFVAFHIINFLRPFLFNKSLGERLEHLPFGVGIWAGDLVSGFFCNIFLQLIIWVGN